MIDHDTTASGGTLAGLPAPVTAFLRALNAGEPARLMDSFAERALVNDELREHWNRIAIEAWAARVVVEQRLTILAHDFVVNGDHVALRATADGSFDKRGLPDPLRLSLYFSVCDDKIVQLIIMRNEPDVAEP